MRDEQPEDLQATVDQAQANTRSIAPIYATMYKGLRKQGLGKGEAALLTGTMYCMGNTLDRLFGLPRDQDQEKG